MVLSSNVSLRVRWATLGAAVAVTLGGGALSVAHATTSSGERAVFVPITPCRLFDTRASEPVGARIAPIASGETFTQQVTSQNGNCTIPGDATGVAMNVTVVNGTAPSFLTIWPADAAMPLASSLNWTPGAPPTPNKVDAKLSATGAISLYNKAGTVDVLGDVVGYYVDHNHDDRYYTKAEVYSKAELDNRTVRLSVSPYDIVAASGGGGALFGRYFGCAILQSTMPFLARLGLDLPIGARLVGVDIAFLDDTTAGVYSATLFHNITTANAVQNVSIAYTDGGSGSGSRAVVRHHLTPNAAVSVGEDDTFTIDFTGITTGFNAVCTITVEYDPAP